MKFRGNGILQRTTKRQRLLIGAGAGVLVVMFMIFGPNPGGSADRQDTPDISGVERVVMDLTRGARAERSWLDISENEFGAIKDRLADLEENRAAMARANDALREHNEALEEQYRLDQENAIAALDAQSDEIERLRAELENSNRPLPPAVPEPDGTGGHESTYPASPFMRAGDARQGLPPETDWSQEMTTSGEGPMPSPGIEMIRFDRDSGSKRLEHYVPAGAYAPAVVVSGVDAGVGVENQSNPRPVLFRITGPAVSAAFEGTRQTIDLGGCLVTGAAIGDLSSEKVYVRLQKMTCSRKPGMVFEASVEGYMTGAGKAGVRGEVVSREGDLITKSFLSGAISGIGTGLAQATVPGFATVGSITTPQKRNLGEIARTGVGSGIGTAGDRISDYLIKRAEQYQPVVVMQSGTPVELVFIQGVHLRPERPAHKKQAASGEHGG